MYDFVYICIVTKGIILSKFIDSVQIVGLFAEKVLYNTHKELGQYFVSKDRMEQGGQYICTKEFL